MTEERYNEGYFEVINMMRAMYHKCHLVHADLSEYNMLYVLTTKSQSARERERVRYWLI